MDEKTRRGRVGASRVEARATGAKRRGGPGVGERRGEREEEEKEEEEDEEEEEEEEKEEEERERERAREDGEEPGAATTTRSSNANPVGREQTGAERSGAVAEATWLGRVLFT
ncbi:hypothetical protein KM043_002763 [Ampulex compressa]|nr:hypothetical protein KM043_002763 [Ampulex compressa]